MIFINVLYRQRLNILIGVSSKTEKICISIIVICNVLYTICCGWMYCRHVSPVGIDFMKRLLVKDPNYRCKYITMIFIIIYLKVLCNLCVTEWLLKMPCYIPSLPVHLFPIVCPFAFSQLKVANIVLLKGIVEVFDSLTTINVCCYLLQYENLFLIGSMD